MTKAENRWFIPSDKLIHVDLGYRLVVPKVGNFVEYKLMKEFDKERKLVEAWLEVER